MEVDLPTPLPPNPKKKKKKCENATYMKRQQIWENILSTLSLIPFFDHSPMVVNTSGIATSWQGRASPTQFYFFKKTLHLYNIFIKFSTAQIKPLFHYLSPPNPTPLSSPNVYPSKMKSAQTQIAERKQSTWVLKPTNHMIKKKKKTEAPRPSRPQQTKPAKHKSN